MTCSHQVARRMYIFLAILVLGLMAAVASADGPVTDSPPAHSRKGADTCLKCHDGEGELPVLALFATPHGQRTDPRSPMSQLQCESCHGPGGEHTGRVRRGQSRAPMPNFGPNASADVHTQNQACLNCHQGDTGAHWAGSEHAAAELSCANCHQVHQQSDPKRQAQTQNARCGSCHLDVKADSFRPFTHPLRSGNMRCSDCHTPHGGLQDNMLPGLTPNQSCFSCHADKRGPLLWTHEPVSENCSLCHQPHGSSHPDMLTQRPPFLCQGCHAQADHPGLSAHPSALPSSRLSLRACGNCHSEVHGSNHPSGAALMR